MKNVPPFCTAEVIDADPEHEPPYLVVEYVDGPVAGGDRPRVGPLSRPRCTSIGLGMATALTAIHSAGVIHRDLKPANVLLPRGGAEGHRLRLARDAAGVDPAHPSDQVMGTIAVHRAGAARHGLADVTPASDIFAWGAVIVYAATGRTPFAGDFPASTAVRILTEEPDLEGVTGPLRDIVNRTLNKAPQHRPTARELLDELISLGATRAVSTEVLRPAEAASGDGTVAGPVPGGRVRLRLRSRRRAAAGPCWWPGVSRPWPRCRPVRSSRRATSSATGCQRQQQSDRDARQSTHRRRPLGRSPSPSPSAPTACCRRRSRRLVPATVTR